VSETGIALQAVDLHKTYVLASHTIEVLRGVNLSVGAGEWLAVTGQSGCGKTTLLHLLGALDKPCSGDIVCCGQSLSRLGAVAKARLRRRRIGFIFQSYQLFPELTAHENVMLAGRIDGVATKLCRERARELLAGVGMEHRLAHRPAELSGGEQQRIAVARALMNRPDVILADEPTGNLDHDSGVEVMRILQRLHSGENLTIIMGTHDRAITEFADRTYVLAAGRLALAD